jgi:predicted deacylase
MFMLFLVVLLFVDLGDAVRAGQVIAQPSDAATVQAAQSYRDI